MDVWVVTAYRYGDKEKHSYVVGVFNTFEIAKYAGEIEECWRGGNKYECEVLRFTVTDKPDNEKLKFYKQCL